MRLFRVGLENRLRSRACSRPHFSFGFLVLVAAIYPLVAGRTQFEGNQIAYHVLLVLGVTSACLFLRETGVQPIRWSSWTRIFAIGAGVFLIYAMGLLYATWGVTPTVVALPILAVGVATPFLRPTLRRELTGERTGRLLAAFVLVVLVSSALSLFQLTVLPGDLYRRTGLTTVLACAGIFLGAVAVLRGRKQVEIVLLAALAGGVVSGMLALAQYFFQEQFVVYFRDMDWDPRPMGTLGHPNWFGTYLCLLLPLAAAGFLSAGRHRVGLLWLGANAVLFAALLVGQTRGAYLAFGAFAGWLVLRQARPHWRRLLVLLSVFVAVAVIMLPTQDWKIWKRVATLSVEADRAMDGVPGTGSGRFAFWGYALREMPPYFLTGSGLDTYLLVADEAESKPKLNKAHSIYFEYALTIGVPGLLAYLAFVWSCVAPRREEAKDDLWAWGFRASILTYLVQGIFIHDVVKVWPILWIVLALAVVWRREGERAAP